MRPLTALRTLLAFLAAFLVAAGMPAAAFAQPDQPGGTPAGSIGIRLLDAPVALQDDPRAQTYIIDNLPPGTTITRHVMVTNNTGAPAKVDVYAGPAQIADGGFVPEDRGETSELTSWISVHKPTLELDNGQEAEVTVTIAVPKDAPEVEQYAVIWASLTTPNATGGIATESRVGVRVYLSVGEGNGPPSDFTIDKLTPRRDADLGAQVVATVTNTGGRAVDVSGTLALSDGPGGLSAGPLDATGSTIAPGATGEVVLAVPNSASLPAGPWTAEVKLQSGVKKHDMSASLTFPAEGDGESAGDSGSFPWVLVSVVVALLLVGLGIGVYLLARRRAATGSSGTE